MPGQDAFNGESLTFQTSLRDPIRSLRVLVAERFTCCVGQVRLLLEVPVQGHTRLSELDCRVAEHLNCGPGEAPKAAGGRDYITLAMQDGRTLREYGYRRGYSPTGRRIAVITDSDATRHILHL